eukprot:383443-Alexandrium_andersonii.AAC.1
MSLRSWRGAKPVKRLRVGLRCGAAGRPAPPVPSLPREGVGRLGSPGVPELCPSCHPPTWRAALGEECCCEAWGPP